MISQARPYQSDIESITEFGCMRSLKADTGVYPFDANFVVFYQGCTPWIGQWTMGSDIMHT